MEAAEKVFKPGAIRQTSSIKAPLQRTRVVGSTSVSIREANIDAGKALANRTSLQLVCRSSFLNQW